jgi:hypothetical protein
MNPQITITFQLDGQIKTEVKGVVGQSCQTLTQPLERLGATTTELKPEFYVTESISLTTPVTIGG